MRFPYCLSIFLLLSGLWPLTGKSDSFWYYQQGKRVSMPQADWTSLFVTTRQTPTPAEARRLAALVPAPLRSAKAPVLYGPSQGFVLRLRPGAGLTAQTYRQVLRGLIHDPAVVTALPGFAEAGEADTSYVSGKVLLHVPAGDAVLYRAQVRQAGGTITEELPMGPQVVLVVQCPPGGDVFALAQSLYGPTAAVAEPNRILPGRSTTMPNDPDLPLQSFLWESLDRDMDAPEAWQMLEAAGVRAKASVAVVDGHGFELGHPDLAANVYKPYDAVEQDTIPTPINALANHGTACAGMLGEVTNNGRGGAGTGGAYVRVVPITVGYNLNANGTWQTDALTMARAVSWLIAVPDLVASSHSYYLATLSSSMQNSFASLRSAARGGLGSVMLAATGNASQLNPVSYPASASGVIGVAATDDADRKAGFSNYGQLVDVAAPGLNLYTLDRLGAAGYGPGDYAYNSGTSMACPAAAGLVALAGAARPTATADTLEAWLLRSVEKVGGYSYTPQAAHPAGTWSQELGHGRVNARLMVAKALRVSPVTQLNRGLDAIESLACGQSLSGTTAGAANDLDLYGRFSQAAGEAGPDRTYRFTLSQRSIVRLALSGATAGQSLYLSKGLDAGLLQAFRRSRLDTVLPGGTYFVNVDGPASSGGPFSLSLDCQCLGAASCADVYFTKVQLGPDSIRYTSCSGPGGYAYDSTRLFSASLGQRLYLETQCWNSAYVLLYLDLNADGDFSDPGEKLYQSAWQATRFRDSVNIPLRVAIPPSGLLTRMRVRVAATPAAVPGLCDSVRFGDTKDYPIRLSAPRLLLEPGPYCAGYPVPARLRTVPARVLIPDTARVDLYASAPRQWLGRTTFGQPMVYAGPELSGQTTQVQIKALGFVTDTTARHPITFLASPPALRISASGNLRICQGDSVMLIAQGGAPAVWTWGDTASRVIVNAAGIYQARALGANGCLSAEASRPLSIFVEPRPRQPELQARGDTLHCLTLAESYRWFLNDSLLPNSGPDLLPTRSGLYTVAVESALGCQSLPSTALTYTSSRSRLSEPLRLYPNPAADWLEITAASPLTHLEVLDLAGHTCLASAGGMSRVRLDLAALPAGTYLLRCQAGGRPWVGRFVKE